MRFHFVFFLLIFVSTQKVEFEDYFHKFDPEAWIYDDNRLNCIGSEQCIFTKRENIDYAISIPFTKQDRFKRTYHELIISMKNDCTSKFCCDDLSCTKFTGGILSTRRLFRYGSFRFAARMVDVYGIGPDAFVLSSILF